MSRIFLSHSSRDMRDALALKQWLAEQDPPLANEIFLDVDPDSGLRTGTRWKDALRRANARCEAVICLLSANWESSHECKVEYRTAEDLNKQIFVARLEPSTGDELTAEWQRCDLFGDGSITRIDLGGGPPVEFATQGLYRLRDGIRGAGIGAESFVWPPPSDPQRAPYRGWEPLEQSDAAVFFGRDAQLVRALDAVRGMRLSGVNALFVVLGPSGTGKSSFLRAGLLPRLRREDRRFIVLDIVRPERNVLTGESGLAFAICATRQAFGFQHPSLGEVKAACAAGNVAAVGDWLTEVRQAATERLLERGADHDAPAAPTLVLPLDQAEELFSADSGDQAEIFLRMLAVLDKKLNATEVGLIVAATIRTDRYEVMQTHPMLAGVGTVLFNEFKPMPATQFKEVIVGPARRASEAGRLLRVAPDLVERLLIDAGEGADTLPMLALTLSRLYTDYGSTGELTLAHYEALGGMRRVVQTEVDEVLSTDPRQHAAQLESLRAAFVPWLATINPDNDQPMRRVARWADLPDPSRPLIDALVAKRLMVKDIRGGETVVEVALESLLRQWDELAGWLREERKELKDADDLERSASAWATNNRNPAWLLEGSRLADAVAIVNKPGFRQRLIGVHDYLTASHTRETARRAAEEQQRQAELRSAQERAHHAQERQATAEAHADTLRRRSRIMRAVLAVTGVVASVFATMARGQAQDRFRQATGVRLMSEAQGMLAGSRPGGDVRALQQILAGRQLHRDPHDGPLYSAAVSRDSTIRIIDSSGAVESVAFSPDGRYIAAGGRDQMVRIWDAISGEPIGQPLEGHKDHILGVAFSPDGQRLATAGKDTALLWDIDSGDSASSRVKGRTGEVGALAYSPDGRRLATAGWDGAVRIWDARTGVPIGEPLLGHEEGVYAVAFSPDGRQLASGSGDSTVRIWDIDAGKLIGQPLTGHQAAVRSVAFSPDGRRLASGGWDQTARLWDVATGRPVGAPLTGHHDFVNSVAFSPDGRLLASGGSDNAVRLWDADSGTAVGQPLTGHQFEVYSVAFSPDGRSLVSGSYDQTVRVWDVRHTISAQQGIVWDVAIPPDGSRIASGGLDGTIRLWNSETGQPDGERILGHESGVGAVAFSSDGERLASGGDDHAIRIWDAGTGRPQGRPLTGHTSWINSVAFTPDGDRIVSSSADQTIRLWDADTGTQIGEPLTGHTASVLTVAVSPDGDRIASGSTDQTIRLWDTENGEQIGDPIAADADWVNAVAFSPSGDRIVAGHGDGQVRLWDVEDHQLIGAPLMGHTDAVGSVAYSQDGRRIVSGSADGTVRLWDAETGGAIGDPLVGHIDNVGSVAINSERHLIASSSSDGTIRIWPATASPEDLCAKLTANMSQKQWDEWVSPDIDYIKTCPDLPIAAD